MPTDYKHTQPSYRMTARFETLTRVDARMWKNTIPRVRIRRRHARGLNAPFGPRNRRQKAGHHTYIKCGNRSYCKCRLQFTFTWHNLIHLVRFRSKSVAHYSGDHARLLLDAVELLPCVTPFYGIYHHLAFTTNKKLEHWQVWHHISRPTVLDRVIPRVWQDIDR